MGDNTSEHRIERRHDNGRASILDGPPEGGHYNDWASILGGPPEGGHYRDWLASLPAARLSRPRQRGSPHPPASRETVRGRRDIGLAVCENEFRLHGRTAA